ncbi:RlpA-like double-psi beta-barrel-protein domain-containing protein-containing protein [Apiospora kogelbergensis]|uniref:RlpA-like double-psi beta-barrel-protein domain-containing protein-containing protein n=1 Tax=Apiospora kogelbergensis TaxID=1337665 RepID=A0AAW0QJL3_9PEZI
MQFFTAIVLAAAGFAAAAPVTESSENAATSVLEARARSGDMTYYDPGLGACGRTNGPNDAIVAVPFAFFTAANPNKDPMCGRKLKVNYKGKSKTVTIVDKCYGCKGNDIDVTPSVFKELAGGLGAGRVKVTWDFV